MIERTQAYISRIYLIKYADNFHLVEGKEYESAVVDPEKYKMRDDLIMHALQAEMPNVRYRNKKKLEVMTSFKPFNIKELEVDVFDAQDDRIKKYHQKFEKKDLRAKSNKRRKSNSKSRRNTEFQKDSKPRKEASFRPGDSKYDKKPRRGSDSSADYNKSPRGGGGKPPRYDDRLKKESSRHYSKGGYKDSSKGSDYHRKGTGGSRRGTEGTRRHDDKYKGTGSSKGYDKGSKRGTGESGRDSKHLGGSRGSKRY